MVGDAITGFRMATGGGRIRVLVQGITGKQGAFWTERMVSYGTEILAGVSPGRGGQCVHDVPVYDSVETACARHAVNSSVLFVPPLGVKTAALDAIRSGIRHVVILAEHVPVQDVMEVLAEAADRGVDVVGPNCPGVVVPGRYFVGIMPAWVTTIFKPGAVGVVSRSGSLGTLVCLDLVRAGLGQSAFVGIGGDPVLGTTFVDALREFEADPRTSAVVMVGEVGGTMEEDGAECVSQMRKPVVAFVGGQSAPEGRRMGHAGAIVTGPKGSARGKIEILRQAGAHVADVPSQIGRMLPPCLRM